MLKCSVFEQLVFPYALQLAYTRGSRKINLCALQMVNRLVPMQTTKIQSKSSFEGESH